MKNYCLCQNCTCSVDDHCGCSDPEKGCTCKDSDGCLCKLKTKANSIDCENDKHRLRKFIKENIMGNSDKDVHPLISLGKHKDLDQQKE